MKSQQDKTVLVAMNVEIVGKYIKWFDCTKQRDEALAASIKYQRKIAESVAEMVGK